jgi:hypothetical protein
MQAKRPHDQTGSPAPGIIPETPGVHDDDARLRVVSAPPSTSPKRAPRPDLRPARGVLASVLSRMRRDKHPGGASSDKRR